MTDKKKLYHRLKGSRVLPDETAEAIAYLLAEGADASQVLTEVEIGIEQYKAILADPAFQARLTYLKNKGAAQGRLPKTPSDTIQWVRERLITLSRTAEADKVKIDALKALADISMKEIANGPAEGAGSDNSLLEQLAKSAEKGAE
jgi:hypothetical protein